VASKLQGQKEALVSPPEHNIAQGNTNTGKNQEETPKQRCIIMSSTEIRIGNVGRKGKSREARQTSLKPLFV
jgi:hypothetical protein